MFHQPKRTSSWFLANLVVLSLLTCSALGVITIKHKTRHSFILLHSLQLREEQARLLWQQLLIEHGVWGASHRIEQEAVKHSSMRLPQNKDIVLLRSQKS